MALTVAEIAKKVNGVLEGNGAVAITGLAGIREAGPADLTFLANPRYAADAAATRAGAIIVSDQWSGPCSCARIHVKNPDLAFMMAAMLIVPQEARPAPGIHPTAVVAPDARIGEGVTIGPHCVIEAGAVIGNRTVLVAACYVGAKTTIGDDCLFYPHVTTRERVRIGHRCIFHNGAVIGSDGFGYYREGTAWKKIPQVGTVEIGDDVELGANVTIDRARFGKTVIASGVKIDNLVQVAHNVRIGANTAIAAQVGIAGSTTIGQNCQLGGQAGVTGHVELGDNVVVGGGAGVTKDIPANTFVSGFPAMPHNEARRIHAHLMQLPELKKRVDEILGRRPKKPASGGTKETA